MPVSDDLLRHVIGPTPYSSWVTWLAVALTLLVVGFYVGVVLVGSSGRRLRDVPLVGAARDRVARHRHARAVREVCTRFRAGEIEAAPAGAAISREVRRFLHGATGAPVEYMQLDDIAHSEICSAADVLGRLIDVQFNTASQFDVGRVGDDAEELIRSWT